MSAASPPPGGPRRDDVRGPRAAKGPLTGLLASLLLVGLLVGVLVWTQC
ncbi:MAG TPA: hypothetical protein RMH85_14475 [Polyangiaceae bacterium LLY-WYZ-15_(1-7)]|nr:hypothetical protein [Polyangiaceae bacterium LLY-WYZ-15_(1-7)]HJL09705.1 hypothetical protein [Polyangiaceae bacterium LLY-WYZ-15_(1-7)]HJL26100.1 hypothetical protein [Polyangiaceae bacterium LLY-WYZ-15_(1-7)]HJL39601.1 hypothetical protein [Polyangiaceae bacterium LLY-WYZ-15_(1-7)]